MKKDTEHIKVDAGMVIRRRNQLYDIILDQIVLYCIIIAYSKVYHSI